MNQIRRTHMSTLPRVLHSPVHRLSLQLDLAWHAKCMDQPSARSAETATSSSAVPVATNESATSYSIRCPDGTLTSVEDIQQHEVLTCCDGVPVQVIRAVRHEREEHHGYDPLRHRIMNAGGDGGCAGSRRALH